MRNPWLHVVGAMATLVLVSACSSSSSAEQAEQKKLAEQLVAATQAADVAPGLSVSTAEALYGTSAPQICKVLDGGVDTAESLLLQGNPSGRRSKVISTDAVTYERLVVQTYCPKHEAAFNRLAADIDAVESR